MSETRKTPNPAMLVYVQAACIIMPIFCVGMGVVVAYMIFTLGPTGMGRIAWKKNVIATLEEIDKEKSQASAAKRRIDDNENLKINPDVPDCSKPSPLPATFVQEQQPQPSPLPVQE
ncbi:hypothetical protein M3Y97_00486200 [Aphelenchoides bicaudatus]|nr:hypothetical protein M3Y97_00486200 [Aphelenchoides bicaudatus]